MVWFHFLRYFSVLFVWKIQNINFYIFFIFSFLFVDGLKNSERVKEFCTAMIIMILAKKMQTSIESMIKPQKRTAKQKIMKLINQVLWLDEKL